MAYIAPFTKESVKSLQKPLSIRNESFLTWIRQQPCATCGHPGVPHDDGHYYNDPSHIKTRGSGGVDVGNVIPQCRACHQQLGWYGISTYSLHYSVNLLELASEYGARYRARVSAGASNSPKG